MQWLMGTRQGRRFVYRLLEKFGVYQSCWTGEALSLAYKEGFRNAGLALMTDLLQHCPKRLFEMQRENLKHEHTEAEPPSPPAGALPGTMRPDLLPG